MYMANISTHLCMPPIIVGGVIYVPLFSSFVGGAPFVGAWFFENRIEVYSNSWFPYGTWFGVREMGSNVMTREEVAGFSVLVNGVEIDTQAILCEFGDLLLVEAAPVAKARGYSVQLLGDELLFLDYALNEVAQVWWFRIVDDVYFVVVRSVFGRFHAIVYDGQILIEER